MWQNKVSYEYTTRKKRFSKMVPEAYEFLNLLENIRHLNFHIGTAKNLHLYYKDNFLVYIILEPPMRLFLSPNFNGSLKKDAPKNNPHMFFSLLIKELNDKNLNIIRDGDNIRIPANKETESYFDCCKKVLATIAKVDIDEICHSIFSGDFIL